jgi:hypothetical protein
MNPMFFQVVGCGVDGTTGGHAKCDSFPVLLQQVQEFRKVLIIVANECVVNIYDNKKI